MSEHDPASLPAPPVDPKEHLLPQSWALPPDWALPDRHNPGVLPREPGQGCAPRYDTGSDAWLRAQAVVLVEPLAQPGPAAQVAPVTRLDRRRLMTAERAARRSPKGSVVGVLVALAGVAVVLVALLALRSGADHRVGLTGVGQQALSVPVPAVPAPAGPTPTPAPTAPAANDPSPDDLSQPTLPADHRGSSAVAAPTPAPAPLVARVPLTVLNASRTRGLADRAAGAFRTGGWSVVVVANYTGPVPTTTVYFAPGQEQVARRLAAQFTRITRVLPRYAGLPGSGLTVVVTREYQP